VNAQHRFKSPFTRIQLLPAGCSSPSFSTASTLSDIQERQPPPESGHRRGPYGWSMAISQEAGAMSVTITDDGVGAVMFETFMGL
jgi:hypothetical protein